jgi:protein required for attachment to host cells
MAERQSHNVAGESGFYHFYGVVEDRNDPLKAGRLRVRIFGKHSEMVSEVPTNQLPWAQVMLPLNANPNEMVAIADGQLVFGFYADGVEQQIPIIMGQLVVDANEVNDTEGEKQSGFQDMRVTKEVKRQDNTDFANGINNSKNAETHGPQAKLRSEQQDKASNSLFSWQEPADAFAGKYPWIKSTETESGHLIEYDDTPGQERLYIWHRKGTYIECTKDGDVNIKAMRDKHSVTKQDNWDIVLRDDCIHIGRDAKIYVGRNANIEVAQNANLKIGGNYKVDVSGNYNIDASGTFTVNASTIRLN